MQSWIQDLRYAVRQLVRSPRFTLTAPISLALDLVAGIACALPALRASKIDPMSALRCE